MKKLFSLKPTTASQKVAILLGIGLFLCTLFAGNYLAFMVFALDSGSLAGFFAISFAIVDSISVLFSLIVSGLIAYNCLEFGVYSKEIETDIAETTYANKISSEELSASISSPKTQEAFSFAVASNPTPAMKELDVA